MLLGLYLLCFSSNNVFCWTISIEWCLSRIDVRVCWYLHSWLNKLLLRYHHHLLLAWLSIGVIDLLDWLSIGIDHGVRHRIVLHRLHHLTWLYWNHTWLHHVYHAGLHWLHLHLHRLNLHLLHLHLLHLHLLLRHLHHLHLLLLYWLLLHRL